MGVVAAVDQIMIIRMEELQTTRTKIVVVAAVASLAAVVSLAAVASLVVVAASHVVVVSHAAVIVVIKTFAITTNMITNVACITIAVCITCIISLIIAPAPVYSSAVADAHNLVAAFKLAATHNLVAALKLAAAVVRGAVVGSQSLLVMSVKFPAAFKLLVPVGYWDVDAVEGLNVIVLNVITSGPK